MLIAIALLQTVMLPPPPKPQAATTAPSQAIVVSVEGGKFEFSELKLFRPASDGKTITELSGRVYNGTADFWKWAKFRLRAEGRSISGRHVVWEDEVAVISSWPQAADKLVRIPSPMPEFRVEKWSASYLDGRRTSPEAQRSTERAEREAYVQDMIRAYEKKYPFEVEYSVEGSTRPMQILVTYTNEDGGTDQLETFVPWSKLIRTKSGFLFGLVVQNREEAGAITAVVKVNGAVVKRSNSVGGHLITTCSGRVP